MKTKIISIIVFGFLFTTSSFYAQYVIKGKVLGYDGNPMIKADIQQYSNRFASDSIVRKFPVNRDGTFIINLPRPNFLRLRFCGVNHQPYILYNRRGGIYIDQKDTVELNIQLSPYIIKEEIKKVTIETNYNPVSRKFLKSYEAELQKDSTYIAEIETEEKTLKYEVSGLTTDKRTINGTQADDYEVDEGGDYLSVINVTGKNKIKIEFDLKKIRQKVKPPIFEIVKAPDHTKKFKVVNDDYNKRWEKHVKAMEEDRKTRKNRYDASASDNYNWKKDLDELEDKIRNEKDEFLRKAWQISRYAIVLSDSWSKRKDNVSKELAQMSLSEIEPDSPLWSFHVFGILEAIYNSTKKQKDIKDVSIIKINSKDEFQPYMNYSIQAVENHPDSTIREQLLIYIIGWASSWGFDKEFQKYWDQYQKEFSTSRSFERYKKLYLNTAIIQAGKQIPDFNIVSVNSPEIKVSKTSMLGKKYLINFWAAWCGPCRGDLEALRNFKNQFGNTNFSIISVSLCFRKEDIFDFQKTNPMPWFNAHVDIKNDVDNVLKNFEVLTIPKDILVDEKGFIIAVNDLEKIMEILSKK